MRVTVTAKIKNSPVMPVKEFKAVNTFDFDEKENVFGRVLAVRQYFKKKFGQDIDLEVIEVKELQGV